MKNCKIIENLFKVTIQQNLFPSGKEALDAINGAIEIAAKLLKRRKAGVSEYLEYEEYLISKNYQPPEKQFLFSVPVELLAPDANTFTELCLQAHKPAAASLDALRQAKATTAQMLAELPRQLQGIAQLDKRALALMKLHEVLGNVPDKEQEQVNQWHAIIPFILSEEADMVDGTIPLAPGKKIIQKKIPL